MARVLDEDELIEHWTLVGDELDLLTGRTGPSRLGLALWLKFFIMKGCFPAGRSELPDEAVRWVASHVKVPASDLGLFDWEGRTAERLQRLYHLSSLLPFSQFGFLRQPGLDPL